jgi:hypothetical protein
MVTGCAPTFPDSRYRVTLPHGLPNLYQILMVMGINRNNVYRMPKNHNTTVSARTPIAKDDFTIRGSVDHCTIGRRDINTIVSMLATL